MSSDHPLIPALMHRTQPGKRHRVMRMLLQEGRHQHRGAKQSFIRSQAPELSGSLFALLIHERRQIPSRGRNFTRTKEDAIHLREAGLRHGRPESNAIRFKSQFHCIP